MRITFLSIHNKAERPGLPEWEFSLPLAFIQSYLTTSLYYPQFKFSNLNFFASSDPEDIRSQITDSRPDVLAVSCYIWNIRIVLQILPDIRALYPQAKIILGGPEFSRELEVLLKENVSIDYVISGEGERVFKELVESFFSNDRAGIEKIKGLSYVDGAGRMVCNGPAEKIEDVNSIPSPFLSGIVDLNKLRNKLVAIETQRGCMQKCGFCYYPKALGYIRYFDVDRVIEEIKLILSYQPKFLYFADAVFNSNRTRTKKILSAIKKYNTCRAKVSVSVIPDILDEELIVLSKDAGIDYFDIGVQSLNAEAVALMGRYRNEEKLFHNLHLAAENGIKIVPSLIYGLPKENKGSFYRSFDRVYDISARQIDIWPLLLLPGTRYRENVAGYGIEYEAESPYTVIRTNEINSEEMQFLHRFRKAVMITLPMKSFLQMIHDKLGLSHSYVFDGFIRSVSAELFDLEYPAENASDKNKIEQLLNMFEEFYLASILNKDADSVQQFKEEVRKTKVLLAINWIGRQIQTRKQLVKI